MPSDYLHSSSKPTQRQRQRFGMAAQRWKSLPPIVKYDLLHNIDFTWARHSPTPSFLKVLSGMQLFMSQEVHSLQYLDKHFPLPIWTCIALTEPTGQPLPFYCNLYHTIYNPGTMVTRFKLNEGNTFFYPVPDVDKEFALSAEGWYIWPEWLARYYLQELIQLRQQVAQPKLYERGYRPAKFQTIPNDPNWIFKPPTLPGMLWHVDVHEMHGPLPDDYYEEVMAKFLIYRYDSYRLHMFIVPMNFHYKTEFKMIYSPPNPLYWTVNVSGGGQISLEPNHMSVVINMTTGAIDHYED
jgi:hypothetical protein